MKICSNSINNNNAVSKQSFKAIPAEYHRLPEIVGKIGKIAGEYVGMPEQKLFLATSALMLQPVIDLKFADEDKKDDAAIKSASKAIAGGVSGVTIRAICINLMNKHVNFKPDGEKADKIKKYLLPTDAKALYDKDPMKHQLAIRRLKQYNMTIGSLIAMLVMMLFTNKSFDVPFTSDLQDFIGGIVKENKTWARSLHDVSNKRYNKIKNSVLRVSKRFTNIKNKFKKIIHTIKSPEVEENNGSKKK